MQKEKLYYFLIVEEPLMSGPETSAGQRKERAKPCCNVCKTYGGPQLSRQKQNPLASKTNCLSNKSKLH